VPAIQSILEPKRRRHGEGERGRAERSGRRR
jgi:hypothetical protein